LDETYTFIKFDLPKLTAAETIFSAVLGLRLSGVGSSGLQIDARKVKENWESTTLNWSNKPDYEETKIEEYQIMTTSQPYLFDITGIVKDWYNTGENYGVMLKSHVTSYNVANFNSSDSPYSNFRPQVIIFYVNNVGLENYWTYHSQDVGRGGTGYVNDYTGNLVFIHNDISMNGNRMPVTINHVYNSNDKDTNIGYGPGWRLNLTQSIKWETISGANYFTHIDEDGTKHFYKYNSEKGHYIDDAGTDFILTVSGSGTSTIHTIKDKDGNKLNFDYYGILKTIEDKNGNKITLTHNSDGRLIRVEDGAGRAIILNYNVDKYLIDITDPAGRRTDFRYTVNRLTSIIYSYENNNIMEGAIRTTFAYDGVYNLTSATNYDGYKMVYSYYDTSASGSVLAYRVKKVQETHTNFSSSESGQILNISYGKNTTTFTDHKGRTNIYQFNHIGNTVSIKDADNNGSYYKFHTSSEKKNKLELDSKLQKTVINLLKNHNMEIPNSYWTSGAVGTSTGSGEFTTEEKNIGEKSLKISKTNTNDRQYFSQQVT
ncbi:DNRLRE domain-containing protein, partial [Oxobacter pfennigii]|uniref:DNRLRE domain-containing protein n=1 Tax=Oxobacter pfennigii TaxID=36849 RepID=UPI00128F7307